MAPLPRRASLAVFAILTLAATLGGLAAVLPTVDGPARHEAPERRLAPPVPGTTPAAFVPDLGQWDVDARYVARFGHGAMLLQDRGWIVNVVDAGPVEPDWRSRRDREPREVQGVAVRMTFEGSAEHPETVGEDRLSGHHNYFLGTDESRWRTHVPLFGAVLYRQLYPGVDVRVRQADGHPEYDLLLEPGADLGRISVRVEGAEGLRVAEDGALVIDTALGPLTQPLPATWQTGPGGTVEEVACRYVRLGADRFGFAVRGWNPERALTIDPGLVWSTYLTGSDNDAGWAVSIDDRGLVTVAGLCSSGFPVTIGAYSVTLGWLADAFVSVMDPTARREGQLRYSTYFGGRGGETVFALSVSPSGLVTIFGDTNAGIPTTPNAFDRTFNGITDTFVAQLDPSRSGAAQLVYATYLGGSGLDYSRALEVSTTGLISVCGYTTSRDYPTTPQAFSRTHNGPGLTDGFLAQLDPRQPPSAQLSYSTYVGTPAPDVVNDLAVDAAGRVTVTGWTLSASFPTTRQAFDPSYNGGYDAFVMQLDPAMNPEGQLRYSTYLGGNTKDEGELVLVDTRGLISVIGNTESSAFPTTPGSYDTTFNGGTAGGDVFVCQIDPLRAPSSQLTYSTFLGGSKDDVPWDAHLDPAGCITVAGTTPSPGFPTTPGAYSRSYSGGLHDGFISRLVPSRAGPRQLTYSTLLGGSEQDIPRGLAVDWRMAAVVTGATYSPDYPTTPNAFQSTPMVSRLLSDAFVSMVDMLPSGASSYGSSSPGCAGLLPIGVSSIPQSGNGQFSITCHNAPPGAAGALLLTGAPLPAPVSVVGISLWVDVAGSPSLLLSAASNARGAADVSMPLPATPALVGKTFYAQLVWPGPASTPPCPPLGFSASNGLQVTVQP